MMSGMTDVSPRPDVFRRLFQFAPDAHLVTDLEGWVHHANGRAALLLGVPVDELEGTHLRDHVADDDWPRVTGWMSQLAVEHRLEGDEVDATVVPAEGAPVLATLRAAVSGTDDDLRLHWAIRDVGEAQRAQRELQAAHDTGLDRVEQLRDLDRWRTAFMAAGAHDLRSPLAGIRAHAETLLDRRDELTEEQQTLFLHRILHTTDRVARLVDDLQVLDGAARGAVTPEPVETLLGPFVRATVEAVDPRGHDVVVEVDTDVEVEVDRRRIGEAVGHLVDNAIVHTPAGTRVRVRVDRLGGATRITVEDDGPGVPDEVRDRMFVPFVSHAVLEGNDVRRSGLGLALVDLLARMHGGAVEHDVPDGGGARFVLTLPDPA